MAHLPTPLEPLERLRASIGGPRIWIKRDDCTGLATGGNKARKLEFLMAEAAARGTSCVVTQGAVQSNHARQTAAAAAVLGMECHVLLENRIGSSDEEYLESGNVLLDRLCGASVHHRTGGSDMPAEMEALAAELTRQGESCYVIAGGGSTPTGALGYVECARELVAQADEMGVPFDMLVHATGSAGTQAGLVAGLRLLESDVSLLGMGVRAPQAKQEEMVYGLACETLSRLAPEMSLDRDAVRVDCDFVGHAYGLPTEGMLEAVRLLARTEGILLDPVYSGKAMHGLLEHVRGGRLDNRSDIVFLHTGGAAALFGYGALFCHEAGGATRETSGHATPGEVT